MVATRATIALSMLHAACSDFSIDDSDDQGARSVAVEETFLQAPKQQIDLLWLLDNTPSMALEHRLTPIIVQRVMAELEANDSSWHLGVITPDGQGVLTGHPWVMTSDTYMEEALAETLDVGTEGAVPQHGLASIIAALTPPISDDENRGFRRPAASLHVIIVSDGDDESDDVLGEDPVSATIEALAAASSMAPEPAKVSVVAGLETEPCIDSSGSATPAPRYRSLATLTDGAATSICSPNIEEVVLAVTDLRANLPSSFTLQASPVAGSLRVAIDGERQDFGWELSGLTVVFQDPPENGSTITARYRVAG